MTLEEKINHLRTTSMEEARAESNAIIDSYRDALEKVFEDHKIEAKRQMQTRIKAETAAPRWDQSESPDTRMAAFALSLPYVLLPAISLLHIQYRRIHH